MDVVASIMADDEATKLEQPGDSELDDPTIRP
jgi:hypothetical protein